MHRHVRLGAMAAAAALLATAVPASANGDHGHGHGRTRGFERVAHFAVYENSDLENATLAEIIDATDDGKTLIYTDAALEAIGFVDIADPEAPAPLGTLAMGGEPTSVAVAGPYALVAVNTTEDLTAPSGVLHVVKISSRTIDRTIAVAGQPDSIKVTPNRRRAAIVIENERDEEVTVDGVEGGLPQPPAGLLQIMDLNGNSPSGWTLRDVDLTGLSAYAPDDPEPEFVDVTNDLAVVTMQENNHIAVVDLRRGRVVEDFDAGTVTLEGVDATEDDTISLTETLTDVPREPDGVAWLPGNRILTANEGDLFGGSRGFSVFDRHGRLKFDSGASFDELAARIGHYPESRSENAGSEPEGVEVGRFGGRTYAFVGSERGSFVAVYEMKGNRADFVQVLPAGWGPEGILAIPQRNLLVVTGEEDDPPAGIRSVISIYRFGSGGSTYPDVISADGPDERPIGWGALSGLAADPTDADRLYAVWDSAYAESRIFTLDTDDEPAVITSALTITGASSALDPEGIVVAPEGGWWVASEGNASDSRPNLLLHVAPDGAVTKEVGLPADVVACRAASTNRGSLGSGFEGVTVGDDGRLYVAQQRGWDYTTPECEDLDDDQGGLDGNEPRFSRIWVYDPSTQAWSSIAYELEARPELAAWVGLSEIVTLPDGRFGLIERDNLTGDLSELKTLTAVDVVGDADRSVGADEKASFDLLPDLRATNGWISDKPEGFTVAADGRAYVVTDNDAVDESSGETQLLRFKRWDRLFR